MQQNYFQPISLAVKQYAKKMITNTFHFLFLLFCFGIFLQAKAQNGPSPITFTNVTGTVPTGLASNGVNGVYLSGSTAYVATDGGLSITTNGGTSFTRVNDLNNYQVFKVYASGSTVYAAANGGLFISTDGGATFIKKTTSNGLGDNTVWGVYASGSTIYAATNNGLSISTDGGASFTNKTTANGLGGNVVYGVFASGNMVYAATYGGLSISTNGGASFTNKTTANGLGDIRVWDVYVSGSTIYVASGNYGNGGVSISTNGGASFTNRTTANGLGANIVRGIYASGSNVYAATSGGLSISTDGGATFTNKTTTNGLGDISVLGVYASGSTVYAATQNGLSISTDNASTFVNKTTEMPSGSGLGSNTIMGVYASGTMVYAAALGGLSISTNGGVSFTNKTNANGLGSNFVNGVYASGSNVYAALNSYNGGGLSISTDGGTSFTNKTTANGLGGNNVAGVYVSGSKVYAATKSSYDNMTGSMLAGGLSISTDGGASFINKTTANGLGSNSVNGVYALGSTIYAATEGGLSISTDGGASFTNYTTTNGLGSNNVAGVYVSGSTVYAATKSVIDYTNYTNVGGGLSISTNGGTTFTNYTTANGLGSNDVTGVYASGSKVYVATSSIFDYNTFSYTGVGGLSISTNGGTTFTNYTTANGLGSNDVNGVYVSGNTVYAATQPSYDNMTGSMLGAGGLSFYTETCTPTSSTEAQSACVSYVWHGTTYTTSGAKTWTGTNAAGCDSVVTLNLTIKNATTSTETASACGSYVWHGTTYTTSGAKTWTGTNAAGCDSVVTLNLTIKNATSSTETASACGNYAWHSTTYTTSGAKTWTGTNAAGCDSVVTLNLTIKNATSSTETASACGSYAWHGTTYTTSGTKTWTGTNAAGCDSVVTLNLTIKSATSSTVSASACGSYLWNGTTYTTSGAKTFTTTNAAGCDSVVTLTLTINSIAGATENVTSCLAYTWHGTTYSVNGTYTWTGTTANGCDSTITLNLTIPKTVPNAPASITQTLVSNDCGARKYRFTASNIASGLQYYWFLPSSIGGVSGVTLDSGSVLGQTIRLVFVSNNAALASDSIYVAAYNGCRSNLTGRKLVQTALAAPLAPLSITIQPVAINICGARKYRYIAPALPAAVASNGPATGWEWAFTGELGASVTIDSGSIQSRVVVVSFSSNAAAVNGDSVKLRYSSNCGNSGWKAMKLTNTILLIPSLPFNFTQTPVVTNVCNNRVYRYTAPALPVATGYNAAATGYLWSFVGTLGSNALIDSGTVNSSVIRVVFTNNNPAGVGDSVRLAYTSGCGTTANKSYKLINTALILPIPSLITQTLVSNNCGARVYRYTASALTSATTASPAATGYAWTLPSGPLGSTGTLDSGSLSGRVIKVIYSSNVASTTSDSIKVAYLSGCGTGSAKGVKLSIATKTGCPASSKGVSKTSFTNSALGIEVQVVPNPTSDKFRLIVTGTTSDTKTTAVIMDIQGRNIKTLNFNSNSSLDFGNELIPGTYMIRVIAGKEEKVMKLVKQ